MKKKKPSDPFRELTWDDLDGWAGSTIVSRGRSYQRGGLVSDLACTKDGGVIAWVSGTQRYATRVDMDGQELTSVCSRPYWTTCKYAVAVVCEYLECLKQDTSVPTITDTHKRLTVLEHIDDQDDDDDDWDDDDDEEDWGDDQDDDDDWDDDDDDDDWDDDEEVAPAQAAQKRSGKSTPNNLSSFLEKQFKDQLMALLTELAREKMAVRCTLKKLKREAEWKTYLADLKEENKRKRCLVEILDGLEGRPIVG